MNNLPKGWTQKKFLNILDYEGGSQPPKKEFVYEPKPGYVRLLQIRDFGDKPFPTYIPDSTRLKKVKKTDLLLARYGGSSANDSLGRICTGLEGAYNVALAKLVFDEKVLDKSYVKFLFMGPWFRNKVSQNSRSCQTGFNRDDLQDIYFPIAPLQEQKQISKRLDAIFEQIGGITKRLDKIPVLLKRFRQSVLSAACSGRLTADWRKDNPNITSTSNLIKQKNFQLSEPENKLPSLPNTWEWTALGNYGHCLRGRFSVRPRNDPNYFNGRHPFIQIGDLPSEGGWIYSHTQTLNNKGLAVSKKFPKGTVVIAIVGATIGNTGLLAYDMCFTDSMVGIDTGNIIGNRYVELYLQSRKYEIRQTSYSSGGQPNINLEVLNHYPLALPPIKEQKEIVRLVEILFRFADDIEAKYNTAQANVGNLSQSILAKAFRGDFV